jgi:lipoprotein-anchoring transpeptidase ErfK/SrfK
LQKKSKLPVKALRFLISADALPGEDDAALKTESGRAADLFACANRLVTEPLLTCRVAKSDPSKFKIFTIESESILESVLLYPDVEDSAAVVIDESSEFAWWNGNGIDEQLRQRLRVSAVISASTVTTALAEEITQLPRFHVSERFDAREDAVVIPIFRWSQDASEISGALIGFWLRPATGLGGYGVDDERLQTCRIVGITDEDEVSGRGMRELAASLVLLGITSAPFAATVARAGTDGAAAPAQTESTTEQQASVSQNLRGAKQRKVQAPQQESAKIYQDVLETATEQNIRVVVSISKQRVYLMVGDDVALDSPISSGRRGRSTPTGNFTVSEKDKNHISSIYHCPMKYFLRLSGMSFGLHVGQLPGYPASHGCVRLPEEVAKLLFEKATIGTSVTIET